MSKRIKVVLFIFLGAALTVSKILTFEIYDLEKVGQSDGVIVPYDDNYKNMSKLYDTHSS